MSMSMSMARNVSVKNKTPAPVQITAEQILREARELHDAETGRPSKHKITDPSELSDYLLIKRKEFENSVHRATCNTSAWIKYAQWEASHKHFDRSRSIWERALHLHRRNHTLWLKYAEVEMKNKFINHARNVLDRAVALLPRVDQLWYKYIHMEEMLGNLAGARNIFERWMLHWTPDHHAWLAYAKFETRHGELHRARAVFERLVRCHPTARAWIRYAKFEARNGEVGRCRSVFERAAETTISFFPRNGAHDDDDDHDDELLFVAFAEFEERCNEPERAWCIYRFALDNVPKARARDLYTKFVAFENQYGNKQGIEDSIVEKRRFEYEAEVRKSPLSYDPWFDYIQLEESSGDKARIEALYERAIANVPPARVKCYWKRYIYLWINYGLYLELEAGEIERTRNVYRRCLDLVPHKKFSFSKLWLLAAKFEIRQLNLDGARKILGSAIGKAPKDKIFVNYIEIELKLGNIDRCRKLYSKYLEWRPENCNAWIKYADFETSLRENERARSIFELAISQPALDMPELLWKAYIDFEGEFESKRRLYERLLDRTKHLRVWISFAKLEESAGCIERTRGVFERALEYFTASAPQLKEERAMLLEEWLNIETSFGDVGDVSLVHSKLPKKLKKRRRIGSDDLSGGYEEYIDYLFPEESQATNKLEILEAAYRWKKQKIST